MAQGADEGLGERGEREALMDRLLELRRLIEDDDRYPVGWIDPREREAAIQSLEADIRRLEEGRE
ncbi:MAG: hypothetical protein D6733_05610 [Methanobacteriota archaeon]|nr:MAG: hypothetical protein D6733_05610 [Euryarchaeota archaeon]